VIDYGHDHPNTDSWVDPSGEEVTPPEQRNGQGPGRDTRGTPRQGSDQPEGQEGPWGHPRTAWSAAELMAATFPPPRWAVPGVLPEGLTLLAGPPKIGKSWLSLGFAVAVASGGTALGRLEVAAGDVLYLALEDTARRLQHRLGTVLAGQPAPTRLTFWTQCPRFPAGGAEQIDTWLDEHPGARLVIIDVFARIKGNPPPGTPQYEIDYRAMEPAKHLADRHRVAVVLVHHVRKAGSEDFLNEVSGTHGIAGAADTVMVLKRTRGSADGALHLTGRDVEEIDYALRFDADLGTWQLLEGPAVDHLVAETRARVLAHVRDHPGVRPKQIATATGLDYELVKKTARRMADDGQLLNDGQGHYSAVPAVPPVPGAGQEAAEVSPPLSLPVPGTPDPEGDQ